MAIESAISKTAGTKGLSARERRFLGAKLRGMNDREAVLHAGDSGNTANKQAWRIRQSLGLREYMRTLAGHAIPPEDAVRRLRELVDGKVITTRTRNYEDKEGNPTGRWSRPSRPPITQPRCVRFRWPQNGPATPRKTKTRQDRRNPEQTKEYGF